MVRLQRPATLKEFVIQSILAWRGPEATRVDRDDEAPTTALSRAESNAPPPAAARDTLGSCVFDLSVIPRLPSSPSDAEILRDTLPVPPPVVLGASPARRPEPTAESRSPAPAAGGRVARAILLALVVLAALASRGTVTDTTRIGAAAVHALPRTR
jgi:hypothetical protein